MKLFLCSSHVTKELIPDFEKLFGKKPEGLKTVVITTAMNPFPDQDASSGVESAKAAGFDVTELDIEPYTDPKKLRSELEQYEVIYMNGGYQGYLMQAIRNTGLSEYLLDLIKNGMIYVGSSAGSMIMGNSLEVGEWYIGENEPGASDVETFKLLDFQLYPHFEDELLFQIVDLRNEEMRYALLKDGQAISYDDGEIRFHGGEVIVLEPER